MSIRSLSRWLLTAAVIIAVPAATLADQPKPRPVPQTAPPPVPSQTGRGRIDDLPLLIEEEQVSEHGSKPQAPRSTDRMPMGLPAEQPGLPICDDDDDLRPGTVMTIRCLLWTVNPLAAFLPLGFQTYVNTAGSTLPSPQYLEHPPQYVQPSEDPVYRLPPTDPRYDSYPSYPEKTLNDFPERGPYAPTPQTETRVPEEVGLPAEVERLDFMPTEIELLDVMPAEESETHYELLEPWHDSTYLLWMPVFPLTEIEVGVREQKTGAMLFGLNIELSRTGTIVVNGNAPPVPPETGEVLPQPRPLTDIGPRTQMLESSERGFGTTPIPTPHDLEIYKRFCCCIDDPTFTFEILTNHTRLLQLKEAPFRIQIGDTNIVDYCILQPTELLLQGTKVGSTTMNMWFGDRNDPANQTTLSFMVNVLPDPDVKRRLEAVYKALQDEINRAFPDDYVCLSVVNEQLVVSGQVKDATDASRILQILNREPPVMTPMNPVLTIDPNSVVNLPIPNLPLPQASEPAKPKFVNLLHIPSEEQVDQLCINKKNFCVTEQPAAEKQVQLSVVIAEVLPKGVRTLNLGRDAPKRDAWVTEVADAERLETLRAGLVGLREQGRAKVVAEPCLVTLNGQQGSFHSGGVQAVPHTDANGQTTVQFEEFGTHVTCRPIVQGDGSIRLEVEPEISEIDPAANADGNGIIVSGRTSQRVHTVAEIARDHALVICGPKMGSKSRLLVIVTPKIVETPNTSATYGDVLRKCKDAFDDLCQKLYPTDPQRRMRILMNQTDRFGPIGYEMERFWLVDQPSHLTPERVHGGIGGGPESVHELLEKCQRELSRGHVAGAQDMAQQALERNREETLADPLVVAGLLQKVKEVATIPLGNVEPGSAKSSSLWSGPQGEGKAIGSKERMVQTLIDAFNSAYKDGRFRDAESLATRAVELDPENGMATAARNIARTQLEVIRRATEALEPAPQAATVPQYATLRPVLPPPIDPAVVSALQKILIDSEKGTPAGGVEESEPKDNDHPPQR